MTMAKVFLQEAVPQNDPLPGAEIAMQTFGDFLGFNPHCHILVTDGCFYDHFSRQYGFWRPYLEKVIYRCLDCGDLHNGFACVKCKDCGHE
jgi:hypothetical protein